MSLLRDLATVSLITVGLVISLAAGGRFILHRLRRWSITGMLAIVAVVTVTSTLAGVAATAWTMFFSLHDGRVVLVLIAVGGLVGVAVALLLGHSVMANSQELREAVRSVPDDGLFRRPPVALPAELAELSRELEEAHTRLEEARARERALEASRRELVAWVSHDLRSPLAGLRAMAEALEDGVADDPDTRVDYYAQLRREVDRLNGMVDDLFELARINAGTMSLARQQVAVNDLVSEVVASTASLADTKGVRLVGSTVPDLPVEVDIEEVRRALRNLVVNAIHHTPDDAAVEVSGTAIDGMACVTVSDTCGGIPAGDMERVFDVAFRGEPARAPGTEQGAGLGLAIARGIVEAHEGEIGVANEDEGCRFVVRLPMCS